MEQVQQFHEYLLRQRTYIRNNKRTLQEMKVCWKIIPLANPKAMSHVEYEGMYSTLLYEMTICWDEETNDAILAKMWRRDASAFTDLNFDRYCCSIFYFAEMWVQEITQEAYDRIFSIIRTILAGQEFSPMPGATVSSDSNFKPTLESFDDAFDRERDLESMNLNVGKSITFDAKKYFENFGSPTATIQASNIKMFQLDERSSRTSSLRGALREVHGRRNGHFEREAKACKSGCSNPKLLRPASSRQSRPSVHNSHNTLAIVPPGSPPPSTSRTRRTLLLSGTIALKSHAKM